MKIRSWLITIVVIGFVALIGYEISTWQNVMGFGKILIPGAVLGAGLGVFLGIQLRKPFTDSTDRMAIFSMTLVGGILLIPYLGSMSNRVFAQKEAAMEPVIFLGQEAYGASRFGMLQDSIPVEGYYLVFDRSGKIEKVKLKYPYPEPANQGDQIYIPIRKGFWGVDFVDLE